MKPVSCIILKLFLNFNDSEPKYCYTLYYYENVGKVAVMYDDENLSVVSLLALPALA